MEMKEVSTINLKQHPDTFVVLAGDYEIVAGPCKEYGIRDTVIRSTDQTVRSEFDYGDACFHVGGLITGWVNADTLLYESIDGIYVPVRSQL